MGKIFNVNGVCMPNRHYMVPLEPRLKVIKAMIDAGEYFTVNRARQYGKTTMLRALTEFLKEDYIVISLDFQNIESDEFTSGSSFVHALIREINKKIRRRKDVSEEVKEKLFNLAESSNQNIRMAKMFECFSEWCERSEKPIVLMIDEVDTASDNQVFLDFLAQLRAVYLDRDETPAFQSVILAGVYDVRNIRRKIRQDREHRQNSPWNIAADFDIDMSFSAEDISEMLKQYEEDYHTGMDINEISNLIYEYTSGYPFLVSRLCKLIDEKLAGTWTRPIDERSVGTEAELADKKYIEAEAEQITKKPANMEVFSKKNTVWVKAGVLEAVKRLLSEKNSLFESLIGKLNDYSELKEMIYLLLFQGQIIAYNADDSATDMLLMFGFIKAENGIIQIANRIFETRLYNYFLTLPEVQNGSMYKLALRNKNQFIQNGQLDMEHILKKFIEYFDDVYGDQDERFMEEDGRCYFMLYLKPIINGIGNYYVESRTRNQERTDLIVDYNGMQFVIEMKVWRGTAYNERGEEQLMAYLDYYHLNKGYMLSFNFNNKKKEIGIKQIQIGDKILIEAVV